MHLSTESVTEPTEHRPILQAKKKQVLRAFMYHSVGLRAKSDGYGLSVSIKDFDAHISYLENVNADFFPLICGALPAEGRPKALTAITFDDGYKDNLNAAEILIKRGIPFSIYCIANKVGSDGFLSAQDLRQLSETDFCTIGAHGLTHAPLGRMSADAQTIELQKSRDILEQLLGKAVTTMSLPHGSHNPKTFTLATSAGYELVCSSRPGLNTKRNFNPMHIRRTELRSRDTVDTFISKWHGSDDWRRFVYDAKRGLINAKSILNQSRSAWKGL
jgi:peptidoglycan/xylan/chitin deacetylase (PgdA/CDA1 family)